MELLADRLNPDDIRRTIGTLHPHGDLFETRAILSETYVTKDGRIEHVAIAGTFDDADQAVKAIVEYDLTAGDEQQAIGFYLTLNPLKHAVAPMGHFGRGLMANDSSIARRRHFLIDIDADRPNPKATNATEVELNAALAMRDVVRRELLRAGWPPPMLEGMTGNGTALIYAIDLPAEDGGLIKQVLYALANRFNEPGAKIDPTVSNPSRITRLYGTMARKGEDTLERPQRLARIETTVERDVIVARL